MAVKTQVDVRSFKDAVLAICLAEAYRHDPIPVKDLQASIEEWRRSTVLDQKQVDKYVTPLVDAYVQRNYFNPLAETEVSASISSSVLIFIMTPSWTEWSKSWTRR